MNGNNLKTSNLVKYAVSGSSSKHVEYGYQFVLEVTDSECEDSDNESIFSIQAETTVSARDSSDISTNDESDYNCGSEFEVASSSDGWLHPWSYDRNISSESSPHQPDVDTTKKLWVANAEDSGSDLGDCSPSEVDSDSDQSVVKYRFENCVMCSAVNVNPSFQFCHSCYQIKKTFFPEKPAPRKKRKRRSDGSVCSGPAVKKRRASATAEAAAEKTDSGHGPESGCGVTSGDSGFESLNSQQSTDSQNDGADSPNDGVDSLDGAVSPSLSTSTPTKAATVSDAAAAASSHAGQHADEDYDKCLACLRSAANALFLHGKTGHRCCCYKCAKRIWFDSRRCPICRSKVNNVIRILND